MQRYSTPSSEEKPSVVTVRRSSFFSTLRHSRRTWVTIQIIGGLTLAVLLGWLMSSGMHWGEVMGHIRDFPPTVFAAALAAFLLSSVLKTWRWHVLITGERIGFLRLFLVQNAGYGLNNLSPVRVVSEPVQLALITRKGGISPAVALATLAMEHMMDVFVTAGLLGLGVLLLPELRGFSIQLVGAIVFSAFSLVIFLFIAKGMDFVPGLKRFPFVRSAVSAVRNLGKSPLRLSASFLLSLGSWVLLGVSGLIVANALNIHVGVAAVVVLFLGSLFIVSAVPSPPGGAITFEAAVVYTLKLLGTEGEPALVFAVIMHIILFVPPTLIAMAVLPREGIKMFGRRDPTVVEDKSGHEVI